MQDYLLDVHHGFCDPIMYPAGSLDCVPMVTVTRVNTENGHMELNKGMIVPLFEGIFELVK